jgi:SHS2 domain-containing protein
LRELVQNACRGTLAIISETTGLVPDRWVALSAEAEEPERLLVRFVRELLVAWEECGGLPVAVEVEPGPPEPGRLRGRVGLAYPPDLDERLKGAPKAVTYHDLRIERVGGLLEVRLVLDV